MNLEGLEHKLFYKQMMANKAKPVKPKPSKNNLFSFESQSVMTQETETLVNTDGKCIEMFCPNPLCRTMQYFEGSHDCKHCGGKQRFVNNNLDGKTINDMHGEALETEKHFELELFPEEWEFENGMRVPLDEVDPVEPSGWLEHQGLIKESAKKVFWNASFKASNIEKDVFADLGKDYRIAETITPNVLKVGNDPHELNYEMTCRNGCNRPHFHNTALKWKIGLWYISEDYWKRREKAIENADKKRKREEQHISSETKEWVKRYANKYSRIEMFDFDKLSEQDGRNLTWSFNTKSNPKADIEMALGKLVRKCGLTQKQKDTSDQFSGWENMIANPKDDEVFNYKCPFD